MLHELFITHCTNGTWIMNPFTKDAISHSSRNLKHKGGQSSFHIQTTLLVFQCCEATGVLECMFWEILQQLAELYRTEDMLLTTKDGIL